MIEYGMVFLPLGFSEEDSHDVGILISCIITVELWWGVAL
jgi:hypothetical protein